MTALAVGAGRSCGYAFVGAILKFVRLIALNTCVTKQLAVVTLIKPTRRSVQFNVHHLMIYGREVKYFPGLVGVLEGNDPKRDVGLDVVTVVVQLDGEHLPDLEYRKGERLKFFLKLSGRNLSWESLKDYLEGLKSLRGVGVERDIGLGR